MRNASHHPDRLRGLDQASVGHRRPSHLAWLAYGTVQLLMLLAALGVLIGVLDLVRLLT